MTTLAPAAALVARFRADISALLDGERLGLAVSGGSDSLALLLLASAAFPGRVEAATVDHGLRAESRREAQAVTDLCRRLRCGHTILEVEVRSIGGEGLQGEARRARYAALARWAAERELAAIATAHHADDQAETLLMRLKRGSGIAGLSGIRPIRRERNLLVIRPLLGWAKAELAGIVAAAGIHPADDPSNLDPRFDRTAARDFLAAHPEFEPRRLARSAAALREADEAISWAAQTLASERIVRDGDEWRIDPADLPRELLRRLVHNAVSEVRRANGIAPDWKGGEDVEGLLAALEQGRTATLAGIMASGGPLWRLRLAPPRRST